ncbi:RNA polymerase sigma factor RpoH [Paraglaciecola aquimarina]|uniref:RNA polymerase sigma factor RpoH n=1 Tax=Paraglaciecola algarum TaxID=3050085 RepID=A0ABS9D4M0_9ALTE|nr:RNA polymerase sigma factor RpoH [Paraglaciecola sp. G1-23]MCF2947826.1 RNA polymerase sigma factor RpoH [Paraglaciecola sp. G1-23]
MNTMPITANTLPAISVGHFQAYLNYVRAIPQLSAEEEKALFIKFQKNNDLDAARKIILSHLRFVAYVARGYKGYGLPIEDLVQEGNVGLMKSIPRFDLSYGYRLTSFAIHYIRAEINEYILANWRLVKLGTTKAKRKLFFNLKKMKKKLEWLTHKEIHEVASKLDVEPADVIDMESRIHQPDYFIGEGQESNEEESRFDNHQTFLEDCSMMPHAEVEKEDYIHKYSAALRGALDVLDDRKRYIIESRWLAAEGEKKKLDELGEKFNISAERVRQLEEQALKVLRKAMS